MTDPETHYIHGSTPPEQHRLTIMNEIINLSCLQELGLTGGERILDIGCGLAQFTRAMAMAAQPRGYVLGVEKDPAQLREAERLAQQDGEEKLVELRQGDALDLPLGEDEWGSFDLVHTRFLLEHVIDPRPIVATLVRAACPGGRIVLADDDHDVLRVWPEAPRFTTLWNAYVETYTRLGNDPYVGRKLISLLQEAGAEPHRSTWIFYGGCSGSAVFPAAVENMHRVLDGARQAILQAGLLDGSSIDAALREFQEWAQLPDAALWYAISWAEGLRR